MTADLRDHRMVAPYVVFVHLSIRRWRHPSFHTTVPGFYSLFAVYSEVFLWDASRVVCGPVYTEEGHLWCAVEIWPSSLSSSGAGLGRQVVPAFSSPWPRLRELLPLRPEREAQSRSVVGNLCPSGTPHCRHNLHHHSRSPHPINPKTSISTVT